MTKQERIQRKRCKRIRTSFHWNHIQSQATTLAGCPVWVIHPLADEAALLNDLDLSPAECVHADLYFIASGEIFFLSVAAKDKDSWRYLGHPKLTVFGSFNCTVAASQITVAIMEKVVQEATKWIAVNPKALASREWLDIAETIPY